MDIYVVVTNTKGAEVVEAFKVIETAAELLFYLRGTARREFPKRDVLVWKKCLTPAEAIAFIADQGLS